MKFVGLRLGACLAPCWQTAKISAGMRQGAALQDDMERKTHHLHKGRVSITNARYFVTLCTKHRQPGLTETCISADIKNTVRSLHQDGDIVFYCGTLMPDHLHMLFLLKERLSLGRVVSKLKAKSKQTLSDSGIAWQKDFFDHRLRENETMEPFVFYMFMNPYAKSLISVDTHWPHWMKHRDYHPEFEVSLRSGTLPRAEWLKRPLAAKDLFL